MTQHDTLSTKLAALPAHVPIDFRAITFDERTVWYAHWTLQGKPCSRRLGIDEHGLIAREIAGRILTPRLPSAQPEQGAYSEDGAEPEQRTCEHRRPVVWCEVCRERMIATGVVRVAISKRKL
jgi:hypothetical protein